MAPQSAKPIPVKVFYSYSHKDEKLRNKLDNHLALLQRQGFIEEWNDRMIEAGDDWESEINVHLNSAQIILLLVSDDFIASDYCYSVEMEQALARHERGEARVIPIILRPVDWESSPLGKLQSLPKDAKAIATWKNRDEAFKNVAQGIRKVIKTFKPKAPDSQVSISIIPPQPIVGFVARRDREGRDIVERLKEELAPQNNHLVALWGEGGIGKTTLAAEATRAVQEVFAQRIVWISAEGRPDFSLSTLLDEIATQLGRDDVRALAIGEKELEVSTLIATARTLIVLDNFETISPTEQTRCTDFIASRTPWPALITSRQKVAGARDVLIDAMSPEEANLFLQRLVEQSPVPQVFIEQVRGRISETATRNPLVMGWIVAQINLAQHPDDVFNEVVQGKGDAAKRVFDRSFGLEQLGDDGRAVLLALSLFVPDASRPALAEVAGFGDDIERLKEAVKRIAALRLISMTVDGSRLYIAGLTRELSKARLAKDARAAEFRQRFVAHFERYAKAHAQPTAEDYDALEAERNNLLAAIDAAFEAAYWKSVMRIRYALEEFLDVRGHWDEAIQRGKQAIAAALSDKNVADVAMFAMNVATIRQKRGENDEAKQALSQAVGAFRKLGNENNVSVGLHNLAAIAQEQGELEEARRLYDESLEINKRLGNQSGIADTLHELGRLAQAQGDLAEAQRLYSESLKIEKRLGNQSGIAQTLHNLGVIAQDQGDLAEARRLYGESLEIGKRIGNQSGIASTMQQLGRLAQDQGDLVEARRLYGESLKIKKRIGNQSGIAITLGQLGVLAAQEGDRAEAARLLGEALSIFDKLKSPYAEITRRNLEQLEDESS